MLFEWRFVWFFNNLRIQLYLIISYQYNLLISIIFSSLLPSISGTNTSMIHPHSSLPLNSQTNHSSSVHWILLPAAFLRKIHILILLPDGLYKSSRCRGHSGTETPHHFQKQNWPLFHFNSSQTYLSMDQTITGHREDLDQGLQQVSQFWGFVKNFQVEEKVHHAYTKFFHQ